MKPRAAIAAGALALAGCAGPQSALDPAGDQAGHIHGLLQLMLWICGSMYLLVIGFLAWALWRNRRRMAAPAPEPPEPEALHDEGITRVMTGWAGLMLAGLVVLTVGSFLADRSLARTSAAPLRIKLTAKQWWWDIEYQAPDVSQNFETANELHLPIDRTVEIELRSQDVIHSFWVPNLHGKEDLIPGRVNHITLTPRRRGYFRGQCAEFCGLQHAHMALDVVVDDKAGFDRWRLHQLQSAPEPATPTRVIGRQVFLTRSCSLCHAVAGTGANSHFGPDLTHVAARRSIAAGSLPYSRGALAGWIADPQGLKPGTNMPATGLDGASLNAVVDYLDSLK